MVMNSLRSKNAEQAKVTHIHKNTKEKLRGTQFCITNFAYHTILTPSYITITDNGHNQQCHNTMKAAITYRTNQELKFLYMKKNNESSLHGRELI
jgi:hypothetical protein